MFIQEKGILQEMACKPHRLNTAQRKLGFSCQAFNSSVSDFNRARAQFPTVLIARTFGLSAALRLKLGQDAR